MASVTNFTIYVTFFDAAPPGSNPASRVFRYPHSFFRAIGQKSEFWQNFWKFCLLKKMIKEPLALAAFPVSM
jgi:hypothetical protein